MYNSPIEKIFGEIQNEIMRRDEEHLMTVVSQNVGYVVDKTELLKALQYDRSQYEKGYADAKAIYEKWIPVSDRLPDERKKCLVTFKSGYVGIMYYAPDLYRVDKYDFCNKKGKAGWYDYDSECGYYSRDDVIAWMPLPEPCKVESEVQE